MIWVGFFSVIYMDKNPSSFKGKLLPGTIFTKDLLESWFVIFWLVVEATPLENISQNGFIFPKFRGENKKYLKPPPSFFWTPPFIYPPFPSVRDQAAHPAIHHGVAKSKGQINRFTYDKEDGGCQEDLPSLIKKCVLGSKLP